MLGIRSKRAITLSIDRPLGPYLRLKVMEEPPKITGATDHIRRQGLRRAQGVYPRLHLRLSVCTFRRGPTTSHSKRATAANVFRYTPTCHPRRPNPAQGKCTTQKLLATGTPSSLAAIQPTPNKLLQHLQHLALLRGQLIRLIRRRRRRRDIRRRRLGLLGILLRHHGMHDFGRCFCLNIPKEARLVCC